MKMQRQVIRVVIFDEEDSQGHIGRFIENLRYAGVVIVHETNARDGKERRVFDILPPSDRVDSLAWANANADRMRSFGYNAVSAPEVLHG